MQKSKQTRKKSSSTTSSDVKLPKIPKISMPEDFKIRTRPLFSLPEEVLKLPPPTTKATKLQTSKGPRRKQSTGTYHTLDSVENFVRVTAYEKFFHI